VIKEKMLGAILLWISMEQQQPPLYRSTRLLVAGIFAVYAVQVHLVLCFVSSWLSLRWLTIRPTRPRRCCDLSVTLTTPSYWARGCRRLTTRPSRTRYVPSHLINATLSSLKWNFGSSYLWDSDLSGKPGHVTQFDSCLGIVGENLIKERKLQA